MQNLTERHDVLRRLVQVSFESAFGLKKTDEQELTGLLSSAVKTKLLTAEQSYALRDSLLNRSALDKNVEKRVNARLKISASV